MVKRAGGQIGPTWPRFTPGKSSFPIAGPRFLPAGSARRRAGRPRLPSSTPRAGFSPGGAGDESARGQRDDRSRSCRSAGAAAMCCSDSHAAGSAAGRRRRMPKSWRSCGGATSGIWRRHSADHGWRRCCAWTPARSTLSGDSGRVRLMGSNHWAQGRRPATLGSAGSSRTSCTALRSIDRLSVDADMTYIPLAWGWRQMKGPAPAALSRRIATRSY